MTTAGTGTARTASTDEKILSALDEIRANTRVTAVKLFGSSDPDEENETGRLPIVEKKAKAAHARIDKIERKLAMYAGGIAVAVFIAEYASRVFFKH